MIVGDKIYADFIRFLIHEDLYAWCLRYNTCSAWFLDIRISTCLKGCDIKSNGLYCASLLLHIRLVSMTHFNSKTTPTNDKLTKKTVIF